MKKNYGDGTQEDYFNYLVEMYTNFSDARAHGGETYWNIAQLLFNMEFIPIIEMDINRVMDGLIYRRRYIEDICGDKYLSPFSRNQITCNCLELLIGMGERLAHELFRSDFEMDNRESTFHFVQNLGLEGYFDEYFIENAYRERSIVRKIEKILIKFVAREYGSDGVGGIFPIEKPREDQRNIELWYQMSAYVIEKLGLL